MESGYKNETCSEIKKSTILFADSVTQLKLCRKRKIREVRKEGTKVLKNIAQSTQINNVREKLVSLTTATVSAAAFPQKTRRHIADEQPTTSSRVESHAHFGSPKPKQH